MTIEKIQGLSQGNTDHARRVPTFIVNVSAKKIFSKKIQTYLDDLQAGTASIAKRETWPGCGTGSNSKKSVLLLVISLKYVPKKYIVLHSSDTNLVPD